MNRVKIGERVGCISHSMGKEVFLFGYGKFTGGGIPREAGGHGPIIADSIEEGLADLKKLCEQEGKEYAAEEKKMLELIGNPRIELDDGKVIFGCECWWGPEDEVKRQVSMYEKVTNLDIVEARASAGAKP